MISVITPVYNGKKFIEFCIKNVIEQKCSKVEHIIIDGKSTDRTVDIIKKYANEYDHIRWISEKDKGQSDAMNKGINLAKGEIISFLNVDDYYEPNVLNLVLKIFRKLPEQSILVGNCNMRDVNDKIIYVNKPKNLRLTDLLLGYNINPMPINPSAYFYHKKLHDYMGLYKVSLHYGMDWDFLLKAVQISKVTYLNKTFGNFRFIQGTKTFDDHEKGSAALTASYFYRLYKKDLSFTQKLIFPFRKYYFYFVKNFLYFIDALKEHETKKIREKFTLKMKSFWRCKQILRLYG